MKTNKYLRFNSLVASYIIIFAACGILTGHESVDWKFKTGGIIHATPLLHNEVLYIGSFDSCFYAINIKTGEELWKYKTKNRILTTATIYEEIVCFESGNILYGLSLEGDSLWQYKLYNGAVTNQHDQWDCFRSSPSLKDSTAYIGSEEGLVLGINVKNGEKVFEFQVPQPNHTIETTPLIYNNKIYVGDWDGELYVISIDSAKQVWMYDTKKDNSYANWVNAITTDPVIYDSNVIFAGRSCNLYSLNAETGKFNWKYNEPDKWMVGGPTVNEGKVYMGGSYQRIAYCFNASSGKKQWTCDLGNLAYGKPAATKTKILVGVSLDGDPNTGHLAVIDKSTHKVVDTINFQGQVFSTPVVYNQKIYVGSSNGYVYAIDKEKLTGEKEEVVIYIEESGKNLVLNGVYPNPFSSTTYLTYQTDYTCDVFFQVYDMSGQEKFSMVEKQKAGGKHTLALNASKLTNGVYIYQLKAGNEFFSGKMIVVK